MKTAEAHNAQLSDIIKLERFQIRVDVSRDALKSLAGSAWSKEKPTKPGWYWNRQDANDDEPWPFDFVISSETGSLTVCYHGQDCDPEIIDGEWQPIEPPKT